jgi:hypothetical protein
MLAMFTLGLLSVAQNVGGILETPRICPKNRLASNFATNATSESHAAPAPHHGVHAKALEGGDRTKEPKKVCI